MTNTAWQTSTEIVCLIGVALVMATLGLGSGPGLGDHEAIVALGARHIHETGEWIVPSVGGEAFLRKPPLAFWTVAAASFITDSNAAKPPVGEAAARLPSALAAVLTVIVVHAWGRSMFGHAIALVSGLVVACCSGTFFFAHNAQIEMQLTFFMTAAFACFWFATETRAKSKLFAMTFYIALAAAMLAKAPLPLALVVLPLAVWWFVTVPCFRLGEASAATTDQLAVSWWATVGSQFRRIKVFSPALGLVVFVVIFMPWPAYVAWKYPSSLELWRIEYLARYTGDLSGAARPVWYYLPIVLGLMFPFSLSLPEALASPFLAVYREYRRPLLFLLTILVVSFVFLSSAAFKRPHYLVGCIPTMSLMLGPAVHRLFGQIRSVKQQRPLLAAASIALILIVVVVVGWRFLSAEYQADARVLVPAGVVFVLGIAASAALFVVRHAPASLAGLVVTMTATYSLAWDAMGSMPILDVRLPRMVEQLAAHDITPNDQIIWLSGRPDARLAYYYGIQTERLFTALELAPVREGRRSASEALVERFAGEIERILNERPGSYFVVKGRYWDSIMHTKTLNVRMVFRVTGNPDLAGRDDWVVFTGQK